MLISWSLSHLHILRSSIAIFHSPFGGERRIFASFIPTEQIFIWPWENLRFGLRRRFLLHRKLHFPNFGLMFEETLNFFKGSTQHHDAGRCRETWRGPIGRPKSPPPAGGGDSISGAFDLPPLGKCGSKGSVREGSDRQSLVSMEVDQEDFEASRLTKDYLYKWMAGQHEQSHHTAKHTVTFNKVRSSKRFFVMIGAERFGGAEGNWRQRKRRHFAPTISVGEKINFWRWPVGLKEPCSFSFLALMSANTYIMDSLIIFKAFLFVTLKTSWKINEYFYLQFLAWKPRYNFGLTWNRVWICRFWAREAKSTLRKRPTWTTWPTTFRSRSNRPRTFPRAKRRPSCRRTSSSSLFSRPWGSSLSR